MYSNISDSMPQIHLSRQAWTGGSARVSTSAKVTIYVHVFRTMVLLFISPIETMGPEQMIQKGKWYRRAVDTEGQMIQNGRKLIQKGKWYKRFDNWYRKALTHQHALYASNKFLIRLYEYGPIESPFSTIQNAKALTWFGLRAMCLPKPHAWATPACWRLKNSPLFNSFPSLADSLQYMAARWEFEAVAVLVMVTSGLRLLAGMAAP